MVEKIKRDVRITTIYEGTSEIMEMTIARDRWQQHLKTARRHYHDAGARARGAARPHPSVGADIAALAPARAGRRARALPGRPAHPQPARPAAARRAGRLAPNAPARSPAAPRRPPTASSPAKADAPLRADGAGRDQPGLRPRGGAEGRRRTGLRLGRPAPPTGARPRSPLARLASGDPTAAQAGLLADIDAVADALYGRAPAQPLTPRMTAR